MRKHCLGAAPKSGSWSPAFKVRTGREAWTDKTGRRNTSFMSYFPTAKGTPRMEGLRHYFHKDMALILDARPNVMEWTANTASIVFGRGRRQTEFTPDFDVQEEHRTYSVRLLCSGTTRREVADERHDAIDAKYRERGETLVVMTSEELAGHPHLPAALALFRNRGRDWPEHLPQMVADAWADRCPTTLGDIQKTVGVGRTTWFQLLSLASLGHLDLDLDYPLDADMPVLACRSQGHRQ
jgi:hypothetical protein